MTRCTIHRFLLPLAPLALALPWLFAVPLRPEPPRNETKLDLGGGVSMTFVRIPAGEFRMGSTKDEGVKDEELPQHLVEISRGFYLGKYHVTRGQFRQFVTDAGFRTYDERRKSGCGWDEKSGKITAREGVDWQNPGFPQTDEHPVVCVTWKDAAAFTEWLAQKSGKAVRLPTEAEWEYSCRAGATTRYFNGDDPEDLPQVGNVADASLKTKVPGWRGAAIRGEDGYAFTAPVGMFRPNAFGLCDMHGNARQWCADWYDAGYYRESPRSDPKGASEGRSRVCRGGSWLDSPNSCRASYRNCAESSDELPALGFRVAFSSE